MVVAVAGAVVSTEASVTAATVPAAILARNSGIGVVIVGSPAQKVIVDGDGSSVFNMLATHHRASAHIRARRNLGRAQPYVGVIHQISRQRGQFARDLGGNIALPRRHSR